jgi:DNA repair protein RecN (Recombination protein N)
MSLKRIVLRDFVIVHELDLELSNGFSVLTGETGAGKSILIDALQLVTGARADVGTIRHGAARTEVCAEFDASDAALSWMQEAGFEPTEPGGSILLRRTVDSQGKSRAWINGSPATAAQLRELGELMLDIHGQHAWQSLARPAAVRALLDAYGRISTEALGQAWTGWRTAQARLEQARAAQDSLAQERDRLQWQIDEVGKLGPGPDEWSNLNTEHTRLSHAQGLLEAAQTALQGLEGDDDDSRTGNALACVGVAAEALERQASIEPAFTTVVDSLQSALAQLEDAAHTLKNYLRSVDLDPERLALLDVRMSNWIALARRYRRAPEELAGVWTGWKESLLQLEASADLKALQIEAEQAHQALKSAAQAVSKARSSAARRLSGAVTEAMQGLGLAGGRFEVALEHLDEPASHGNENVLFLMAGHPGTPPRPVGKIASGGELSRVSLAIAVTTSQLGASPTLIFDEVDAGIGGAVAETVGRLMRRLGVDRQVLAVTHLPQVAACADNHLLVAKSSSRDGTSSQVVVIRGEERVGEIARMLGGERLSGTSLAHAREMLEPQTKPTLQGQK